MGQLPENNTAQSYMPAEVPPSSLGRMLREERVKQGLSVADVANQIKFATRQIDALEADDFRQLQGATFLRGFVRSYAKILQLDAQALIELLPLGNVTPHQMYSSPVEVAFPSMLSTRKQNLLWTGSALVLVVILLGFGFWQSSLPDLSDAKLHALKQNTDMNAPAEQEPELLLSNDLPELGATDSVPEDVLMKSSSGQAVTNLAPAAEKTAPPKLLTVTPAAKPRAVTAPVETIGSNISVPLSTLHFVFGEESWTEVKDRNGAILSSQINQPGTELRIKGQPPFTLLVGRGLTVRLYQDDEPVDLIPYINRSSEVAHLTLE